MRINKKAKPHSPRYNANISSYDFKTEYEPAEALKLVKQTANAKFVESVDLAIRLGIDPRKGDQNVRGLATIPNGTGKKRKVAVLARGEYAKQAEEAGADVVGGDDLIAKIKTGWKDFDMLFTVEDMAPQLRDIGRLLGPKTPNKKNGTITNNIGAAIAEVKAATRTEYRTDKEGVVHLAIGKVDFSEEKLLENFIAAFGAILKAKPSSAKGKYIESVTLSASMGPGIKVDGNAATKLAG